MPYITVALTICSKCIGWNDLIYCHVIKCERMLVVLLQLVKAGLALGLFGGTHKFLDDKVVFIHQQHVSSADVAKKSQICTTVEIIHA